MYSFKDKKRFGICKGLILTLMVFLLLLPGCFWNKKQAEKSLAGDLLVKFTNKTYVVERLAGSIYLYKKGLPHTFTLHFERVCIKDSQKEQTPVLEDTKFIIEYETAEKNGDSYKEKTVQIPVHTNKEGCIQWSEEYPYKHTFKARWIGLNRTIKGADGSYYHGKEVIETAANPWILETEEGKEFPLVIDRRPLYYDENAHILQRYSYEPEGLKFLTRSSSEKPQLWVPAIGLQMRFSRDDSGRKDLDLEELIKSYTTLCGFDEEGHKVNYSGKAAPCYIPKLTMVLDIPLEIMTLGVKGEINGKPIRGGTYNVKAYLAAQLDDNESQYYTLHKKQFLEKKNVNKGRSTEGVYQSTESLTVEFPMDILVGNRNATYKIVLEIENNEDLFKKFQGIYTLKNGVQVGPRQDNIENDPWLKAEYRSLFEERNFQTGNREIDVISSVIKMESLFSDEDKTQQDMVERLKGRGFHPNQLEVTVKDQDIRFANVKTSKICKENENIIERTIEYSVEACFKDFFNKHPKEVPFRIIIENPAPKNEEPRFKEVYKEEVTGGSSDPQYYFTRSDACIKMYDELKHKNYNRQIYNTRTIHYISLDGQFYGKAHIGLNPWQGQFQFGKDLTTISPKKIRTTRGGVPFPRLVINQFRAINFFPSYLIDKLLNIHISHNYYFLFQVIIVRHDNIEHGRHPMGREFIRDGYHLARILIMRNPQEVKVQERVESLGEYNKEREQTKVNELLEPSFIDGNKVGEYLSHIDTVIKVRGNWVNIYVPTHFTHQQFIYIASRNQVSIEVYPADPEEFEYKNVNEKGEVNEGEDCELDLERTVWKPYLNCKKIGKSSLTSGDCHELEILPHTAPLQTNEWSNWNVLRPVYFLDTDKIIDQSAVGKKRRLFTLYPKPPVVPPNSSAKRWSMDDQPDDKEKPKVIPSNPSSQRWLSIVDNQSGDKEKPKVMGGRKTHCPIKPAYPGEGTPDTPMNDLSGRYVTTSSEEDCFGSREDLIAGARMEDFPTRDEILALLEEEKEVQSTDNSDKEANQNILPEALKKFADDNALKLVDLSHPEEVEKLVTDLNEMGSLFEEQAREISKTLSHHEPPKENETTRSRRGRMAQEVGSESELHIFFSAMVQLLERLGVDKMRELENEIQEQCVLEEEPGIWERVMGFFSSWYSEDETEEPSNDTVSDTGQSTQNFSLKRFFISRVGIDPKIADYSNGCVVDLIRTKLEQGFADSEFAESDSYTDRAQKNVERNSIAGIYDPSQKNLQDLLIKGAYLIVLEMDRERLKSIVNEGVTTNNYKDPKIGSFIHNLCGFWFEKYFSDYLESEQMISAYANFIRKFDYNSILENRDINYSNFDLDGFFKLIGMDDGSKSKKCVKDYTNCLLNARCNLSDSRSCKYKKEDNSCSVFVENYCLISQNPSHLSCQIQNGLVSETHCQEIMNSHCRQNLNQTLCHHYNDRCRINQENCFSEMAEWFEELKGTTLFDTKIGDPHRHSPVTIHHPFQTCLANPFEFFRFERKMSVLELDPDSFKYLGGVPFSLSASSSHSVNSSIRWDGQISTTFSVGPSVSAGGDKEKRRGIAGPGKSGRGKTSLGVGNLGVKLTTDIKTGMGSSVSNSGGRDVSIRVVEGAYLSVHQSRIEMGVKKFQKCLVIKPRPNAFFSYFRDDGVREEYGGFDEFLREDNMTLKKIALSRPGLLICNPIEERDSDNLEMIEEHYYYVMQDLPKNIEFMFLYDVANRPYTMIFRGQKEFFKYFSLLKEVREGRDSQGNLYSIADEVPVSLFAKYSYPVEEIVGMNYSIKTLNETGFYPGIYTYPDRNYLNPDFFRKHSGLGQKSFEWIGNINPFPVVEPPGGQQLVPVWGVNK